MAAPGRAPATRGRAWPRLAAPGRAPAARGRALPWPRRLAFAGLQEREIEKEGEGEGERERERERKRERESGSKRRRDLGFLRSQPGEEEETHLGERDFG